MPDVLLQLKVNAPPSRVFKAFATPAGLDSWWTLSSSGDAELGSEWRLYFGPGHVWRARVTRCVPGEAFEWTAETAMDDWIGTRVGVTLTGSDAGTVIDFYHCGWAEPDDHYRISGFCWASYLRLLRRNIEFGEFVPYELRNDV